MIPPINRIFTTDLEGRTIKRACKYGGEKLSLLLDDGSVYMCSAESGYYGSVSLEDSETPGEMEWIDILTELGVMTEEEKEQAERDSEAKSKRQQEAAQRAQFEALKAKFEGKP